MYFHEKVFVVAFLFFNDYVVPDGQTKYTKQKCKDGPKGACFELVNAAGQPEVTPKPSMRHSLF